MPEENSREIKRRIKSIGSIEHITNAMKLVSGAKYRKTKIIYEKTNKNLSLILKNIEDVLMRIYENGIKTESSRKKTCLIIVTSNGGLCGNFSSGIIKRALKVIKEEKNRHREIPLIAAVGAKGNDYFKKREYEIISDYMYPPENILFEDVHEFCLPFIKLYENNEIDKIVIIYNCFIGGMNQKINIKKLLPYEVEQNTKKKQIYTEYEPSMLQISDYITKKYLQIAIYSAIIESAACEHAARRIAMENATESARDLINELKMQYNILRQDAITDEISEIVRSSEVLKNF